MLWGRKAASRDNEWEAGRTEAVAASVLVIVVHNDTAAPRACVLTTRFLLVICEPKKSKVLKSAGSWACQTKQLLSAEAQL